MSSRGIMIGGISLPTSPEISIGPMIYYVRDSFIILCYTHLVYIQRTWRAYRNFKREINFYKRVRQRERTGKLKWNPPQFIYLCPPQSLVLYTCFWCNRTQLGGCSTICNPPIYN